MLTHWIVDTDACSAVPSRSRPTLTIVVSRMTVIAPVMMAAAIRRSSGSIGALAAAVEPWWCSGRWTCDLRLDTALSLIASPYDAG